MDNFIVSARKYRPPTFDSVVGQDQITATLKNAIRNKQLAQAFLFTGPRGVGKTTCARIFAKTINCMNLGENIEPCNECESCISFNRSASFNIHELDAASNNSVEDIRNLVDQVRIPPQVGRYKVYIIDEVHMLSQSAFNAFLKTLEEPPEYAKFILATTEKHKIIPTILSRCQIYDFKRITVADIATYLKYVAGNENVNAEPDALQIIAQKADGAMRDALSIFDQLVSFAGKTLTYGQVVENLNVLDYDYYFKIADQCKEGNLFDALMTLNKIIESGFDGQHFLSGLGAHLRDLLICQDPKTVVLLEVGQKIRERYLEQSKSIATEFLLKALNIVQKTDYSYKSSNSKRLNLEIALMQICSLSAGLSNNMISPSPVGNSDMAKKKIIAEAPAKPIEHEKPVQAIPTPKPVAAPTPAPIPAPVPTPTPTPIVAEPSVVLQPKGKPQEAPAKKPRRPFVSATVSIKEEVIEAQEVEEEVEESFDFDSEEFRQAKPLDKTVLVKVWHEFAESVPVDKPDLRSTLLLTNPSVGESFEIEVSARNPIQRVKIEENKGDLVPFLRTRLNNRFIRLKVNVEEVTEENTKPYLPPEIFKFMASKNSALIDLQKKFGLDVKY